MTKKLLTIFLSFLLIFAIAACSNKTEETTSETPETTENDESTGDESATTDEPAEIQNIDVNVNINWIPAVKNDGVFDQLRAEATGVYTKWSYTQGDEATARRLLLTSGDLPDVFVGIGPKGDVEADLLSAKSVEPIEEYLNMPDKYPNLAKIPDIIKNYIQNEDGHTYFIPTFIQLDGQDNDKESFGDWGQFGFWVRTDILEQAGMTKEDLATMEGFENFLRAASKLKDEQGNTIIPLTIGENFKGWRSVASSFGLDTFKEASGFYPYDGGTLTAARDHENYKKTWKWLNEMYQDGLLDKEAPTASKETTLQKISTGRAAAYIGQMTDLATGPWSAAADMNDVSTKFEAIAFPKVEGVDKIGAAEGSSPFPWVGVYIMKGANMEASLKYIDWALGSDLMTVKYGPAGEGPKYAWNWSDDQQTWSFNEEVAGDLTSGDVNREQKYGAQPWFLGNTSVDDVTTNKSTWDKISFKLNQKNGRFLRDQGIARENHNFDSVPVLKGGVVEKYTPALNDVENEYRAKFLVAKNEKEFEDVWKKYRKDLEAKGKWEEQKKEFQQEYEKWSQKMDY
jgi:putative aldouronate transport system substrate-binding protein